MTRFTTNDYGAERRSLMTAWQKERADPPIEADERWPLWISIPLMIVASGVLWSCIIGGALALLR